MLLEKSAMASDAQNREIKDILLSTPERLSRDDIKAIVKETAKIKKSTPEALSYDQIRTIVRASVTAKQLAAQKKKTISASPSQPRVGAQLATPPISPDSPAGNTIDQAPAQTSNAKDPILYPGGSENHDGATPAPLFTPTPAVAKSLSPETERLVDQHIASRPVELFPDSSSAPTREDYKLALYFASNCFSQYRANPKRWLHQERQLLIDHRRRIDRPVRPAKLPEILPAEKSAVLGMQTRNKATAAPARVEKHVLPKKPKVAKKPQQPRPIRATPAATATTPTATAAVAALITAAPIATSHATSARMHTPDTPRARTVAPSREDKDFSALADLCPPLSTLDRQKANCLKVDWKGNALDLSTDPHRALLHPDELALASNLRLDCATYLTSKRRIFLKRLECARMPKEFRKTDAQQACKIDVNKASKLWQAYERVGWLDEGWIRRFM